MNDSERELLKAWLEAAGADGPDSDHKQRERQEFLLALLRTVKDGGWLEGYSYGASRRAKRHPTRNTQPIRRGMTMTDIHSKIQQLMAEAWTDGYLAAHWDMRDDTETSNPYEEE